MSGVCMLWTVQNKIRGRFNISQHTQFGESTNFDEKDAYYSTAHSELYV